MTTSECGCLEPTYIYLLEREPQGGSFRELYAFDFMFFNYLRIFMCDEHRDHIEISRNSCVMSTLLRYKLRYIG